MSKARITKRPLSASFLGVAASLVIISSSLAASSVNYAINFAQSGAAGAEGATSDSYLLSTTIGQGVAGTGQSSNYIASIGYRQPFAQITPAPTNTPGGPTTTPMLTITPVGPTPTACADPFVDLSGNVFRGAVDYLYCRDDVNGTDSTHYSPGLTSTRGQFAKVVVLGTGLPFYTPSAPDFSDVPPTYFAYQYIESGFHAGVLSGFDQSTCTTNGQPYPCYLPGRAITRGQLTKLVVGAGHYALYTPSGGPDFSDVPTSNVFYASIETAYYNHVVGGYPDHTFRPQSFIRRDEMAQIVFEGIIHMP